MPFIKIIFEYKLEIFFQVRILLFSLNINSVSAHVSNYTSRIVIQLKNDTSILKYAYGSIMW